MSNYVGLFEGISGFGLAFKRAGANILAVCEIDKTCQSVLRRHHTEAEIISDVKTITKESFRNRAIDVLCGGFPCQDLSVAGLRKGLDGERSGLWFEFLRIITDHKPRIVVIENVPGLLSSNGGRDFAIILRGLVECGYSVCWRVFDSQFDGVAQRRNRVFIVASLGTSSCVEILFERDGGAWDSPPSREAGQGVAGTSIAGTVSSKWAKGTGGPSGDECYNLTVAPTLRSNGDAHSGFTTGDGLVIEPQIAHSLTAAGADASEDGTGRGTPLVVASRECAQSLTANYGKQPDNSDTALGPNLAIAYNLTFCDANGRRADRPNGGLYVNETEQANTLTNGEQGKTLIATFDERNVTSKANRSTVEFGQPANTLHRGGLSVVAMNIYGGNPRKDRPEGGFYVKEEPTSKTLDSGSGLNPACNQGGTAVIGQFGVRRLTPVECEALQGFPRNWTAFGDDGKPISDSARYRMLGNAVCVPTAEWIAKRVMENL